LNKNNTSLVVAAPMAASPNAMCAPSAVETGSSVTQTRAPEPSVPAAMPGIAMNAEDVVV